MGGRDVLNEMVAQHRTLRVREGPNLLEVRADLLALAGDATAAVRLYSAARRTFEQVQ